MATAKLMPGKPTVTIEGLSYEAAQAIRVWIYWSVGGKNSGVRNELDSIEFALRDIKLPVTLDDLGLCFEKVSGEQLLNEDLPDDKDLPF